MVVISFMPVLGKQVEGTGVLVGVLVGVSEGVIDVGVGVLVGVSEGVIGVLVGVLVGVSLGVIGVVVGVLVGVEDGTCALVGAEGSAVKAIIKSITARSANAASLCLNLSSLITISLYAFNEKGQDGDRQKWLRLDEKQYLKVGE